MKKSVKIFLGIAGVLALLGICFACLSIYAKKEINKPKFELPEAEIVQPVSPLPATKEEAYDYVTALYSECVAADDIELSRHSDIHLAEGERVTPFSDSDDEVFSRVLENAQGRVSGLYPSIENVLITEAENVPALDFTKEDVADFTATKGYVNEEGETVDDGFYYITLTLNPASLNTKAILESEVVSQTKKELESVLSVESLDLVATSYTVNFKISYADDMLTRFEIRHGVTAKAAVQFTEDYKALSEGTVDFEIPLEAVHGVDLFHYGLRFTERQMAVQKSDMKALPLEVRVDAETTKENYNLTFEVSDDGILEIDKDGVMTVIGTQEEPVTVTATLEYDGHTYTDKITIYATELEVKTDEPGNN